MLAFFNTHYTQAELRAFSICKLTKALRNCTEHILFTLLFYMWNIHSSAKARGAQETPAVEGGLGALPVTKAVSPLTGLKSPQVNHPTCAIPKRSTGQATFHKGISESCLWLTRQFSGVNNDTLTAGVSWPARGNFQMLQRAERPCRATSAHSLLQGQGQGNWQLQKQHFCLCFSLWTATGRTSDETGESWHERFYS